MPSCLGIYVENNLIKYAKIKKNKDNYKVEAFSVESFDDLNEALKKVIVETASEKIPVSLNVSNELYNYFDVYSMLEKKDITKSLDIEFEMLCNQKGYDKNSLESRYILMDNKEDPDKYKSMYVSVNKRDLDEKIETLSKYKLASISPISTSITNLLNETEENIAIINIENETQITTVINGQISRVDILSSGIEEAITQINRMEMSWKKAYNVFKNITIYDPDVKNLNDDENEYMDLIMPCLYKIGNETKKLFKNYNERIDKIYITGTGATINNIDLYFQEFFGNTKCEVLKPFFINPTSLKFPTKEYIEVNSAIAIALDGLGFINKDLNFAPVSKFDSLDLDKAQDFDIKNWKESFKAPLSASERVLTRIIAVCIILIIGFTAFGSSIMSQIDSQTEEIQEKYAQTEADLNNMREELKQIETQTNAYTTLIENADSLNKATNNTANSRVIPKDAIPNLLGQIMFIIPQQVQIISIENTENKHIVIKAQSEKYEQLGFFSGALKNDGVLKDVQSTTGTKTDSYVQVTIEGDLP